MCSSEDEVRITSRDRSTWDSGARRPEKNVEVAAIKLRLPIKKLTNTARKRLARAKPSKEHGIGVEMPECYRAQFERRAWRGIALTSAYPLTCWGRDHGLDHHSLLGGAREAAKHSAATTRADPIAMAQPEERGTDPVAGPPPSPALAPTMVPEPPGVAAPPLAPCLQRKIRFTTMSSSFGRFNTNVSSMTLLTGEQSPTLLG